MRMRSTGLGKTTELIAEFRNVENKSDHLILHVYTTAPVHWHIRVAVNRKDLLTIIKVLCKDIIKLAAFLFRRMKNPAPLDQY